MELVEIESVRVSGGCPRRRPGRQTQVLKDLDDGRWVFNGSQDFEITLAMGAYLNVYIEDAL